MWLVISMLLALALLMWRVLLMLHAHRRLLREHQRYQLAAVALNGAFYDLDLRASTIVWDEGLHAVFGHQLADAGRSPLWWERHVHPTDLPTVLDRMHAVISSGADFVEEYRFRRADGSYSTVWDRGRIVRDGVGLPARMVGCLVDVSAYKLLEEQLRHLQRIEIVGTLASGIAHDFNNMLVVIRSYAQMLRQASEPHSDRATDLDEIITVTENAASLTRQLLKLGRPDEPAFVTADLNELVQDTARMVRPLLSEHIALELLLGHDLPPVALSPAQIQQALLNLCLNARDAMPDGGRLAISTFVSRIDDLDADESFSPSDGRYVTLRISDTGVGMSEDVQRQIFNPFFTTKSADRGSGLGLMMVTEIVRRHGGLLRVSSAVGRGTSFMILLPLLASAHATPAPAVDTAEISH